MFSLIYLLLLPLLWGLSSSQSSNKQSLLLPQEEVNAYNIMVDMLKVQKPPSVYEVCKTKKLARGISIECENQPNSIIRHVVSISMVGLGLTGVLPHFSISRFTHLKTLYLYSNKIEGCIPESLGMLSELAKLDLSQNNLQGPVPNSLGNLSSLIYLNLHSNQLNESIPESIGNLKNLKELYLSRNHFTGSIPQTLVGLKSLHNLFLYLNELSGQIPDFLGTMTSLQQLDLGANKFNGTLPPSFGNLKNLEYLFFPSNELEGRIPDSYAQLKKLYQFSVAGNNLNGTIPSFVKDWTNISRLELMGNNFEGPLPQEIFGLSNLYTLWVSDLIINPSDTFEFPESANFTLYMWSLILRNCSIGGKIPEYIGNMPELRYLDLSLNKLTGGIPDSLQNPRFLNKVSFAGNKLNERFPYWAANKSSFFFQMDISNNELQLDGNTLVDQQIIEDGNTLGPDIFPNMNLFGCCSINDDISHHNTSLISIISGPQKIMEAQCHRDDYSKDNSLFINCGGDKKFDKYEVDNATSNAYVSPDGKWGYSCAGNFMSNTPLGTYLKSAYLRSTKCAVSPLFETARLCPVSLTYYAFCLRKGKYDVQLHFSEIVYAEEENYEISRDRVFDIYIQNISQRQNVNIKSKAGAPNRPWNETFTVDVKDDSPLKIQLLWAGKGDTNDDPLLNGPLISAITVTPAPKPKNLEPWQIVLIVAASIIFCYLVLLGFFWKMGWLENKEWQNTSIKLRDDATVTIKELIDATQNFTTCEIGEGSFGKVYKVEIRNQILAVKKLFEASNIVVNKDDKPSDTENKLRIESYILKSLEHENLIKFFGSFSRKKLHLLVYEYMGNGSLDSVLFGSNSKIKKLGWESRYAVCKGIARGLKYLHEDKAFKIIHRDIKASNILLDDELKAKICDFGLATIYDPNNCIDNTKKGFDGYTPPEYVQRQIFSNKTDIYSFGVLLFEIVSGQRNAVEKSSGKSEFLIDKAYEFLKNDKLIALVDKSLQIDGSKKEEALRILKLAIMCTHMSPAFRPSILEVVSVLDEEAPIRQISFDLLPKDSCQHCGGTGMLPKTSSSASKMS